MMTLGALHTQESLLQPSVFEVIGKFLLYAQVQGLVLRVHHIPEPGIVPIHSGYSCSPGSARRFHEVELKLISPSPFRIFLISYFQ